MCRFKCGIIVYIEEALLVRVVRVVSEWVFMTWI